MEGNLEFEFSESWTVLKYDENGSFYRTCMEKNVKPTKAVDFLCLSADQPLLMLEAKDFSLGVPIRDKFDKISNTLALKVRDTIAGIIGGSYRASGTERVFFCNSYQNMSCPPRVIYFFEDLATPARRPPQRSANKRDVLTKQLKQHLRWLTKNVAVIGLNDYGTFINDLTIRRI